MLCLTPLSTSEGRPPTASELHVGAIRWDGWFAGSNWAKNLEPDEYHERLPFYTTWKDGIPVVNSDSQKVMDEEIRLATRAGLSYWAFVYYYQKTEGTDLSRYNYGLHRYLASSVQGKLNFCLNLQGGHLGKAPDWPEVVDKLTDTFENPTYQRVLGNRPLVYLFYIHELVNLFGSVSDARQAIASLRQESEARGAGNPYIVAQASPDAAVDYISQLGLDACGAYAVGSDGTHLDRRCYLFQELIDINVAYWDRCKATGAPVVPTMTIGWDVRPRWGDAELMKHYQGGERPYYSSPTMAELAQYLELGFKWTKDNPTVAKARTLLIYAWNETDEGGWLVPTLSEGTSRLDAISKVIGRPR